jgi:adenylylsulfate kinase
VKSNPTPAFAVWITGLPSSGKSTLASELAAQLHAHGSDVAVLESDSLRRVLTPHPNYSEAERDTFYHAMTYIGEMLLEHGVSVIFDATAHRRSYRDRARERINRFLEVYVECPLAICQQRDCKGIYRRAAEGAARTVPGLQVVYEAPEHPDVVVRGDSEPPHEAARRILTKLIEYKFVSEVGTIV